VFPRSHRFKALYGGLDILVATVGRLLDLKQQGHIDISQVDTFILDEADRMLDMGFIRDIQKIAAGHPSATPNFALLCHDGTRDH
jgi:ATP-dependent RNA helicase RhlE